MKKLIFLLTLLPLVANGQEISLSPTSVVAWGQAPATAKVAASYKYIEAIYLHTYTIRHTRQITDGEIEQSEFKGGYPALFLLSPDIENNKFKFTGGVGYFFRKFPTDHGTHINFTIKISYKITNTIGVEYSHISNGFGVFNEINPGIDNLSLTISL